MSRGLGGTVVVLTRRHDDNATLAAALRELGAEVLELPCVRIEPLRDTSEPRRVIGGLGPADLLVVTSRAGAEAVAGAARGSIPCGVAAVGPATAERARSLGMRVVFVASHSDGRTLGRELPLPAGDVVLARSSLAGGDLPAILRERGARVREVTAYRTVAQVDGDAASVRDAIARGPVSIVVASPSAVEAIAEAIEAATLRHATFVAIGPRTAARARDRVGATAVVAKATDTASIVRAIPVAIPVGGMSGARPSHTLP